MTKLLPRTVSSMTDLELMTTVGKGTDGIRIVLTEKTIKRIQENIDLYKVLLDTGDSLIRVLEPRTDAEVIISKQFEETSRDMREALENIKQ